MSKKIELDKRSFLCFVDKMLRTDNGILAVVYAELGYLLEDEHEHRALWSLINKRVDATYGFFYLPADEPHLTTLI